MKKLMLFILSAIALNSCSVTSSAEDVAYFDFGGADYWVWSYAPGTSKDKLKEHAEMNSNPQKTVYHFYYSNDRSDFNSFTNGRFNMISFAEKINEKKPNYSCMKMNEQPIDEESAMFLMEQLVADQ